MHHALPAQDEFQNQQRVTQAASVTGTGLSENSNRLLASQSAQALAGEYFSKKNTFEFLRSKEDLQG